MSRQWSFEVIKLDQIIQVDSIIADRGAYPWHGIDARDWVDPNGMFSIGKSVPSVSTKLIVKNQPTQRLTQMPVYLKLYSQDSIRS
jgi:predicted acyltransferase